MNSSVDRQKEKNKTGKKKKKRERPNRYEGPVEKEGRK